MKKRTVFVSLIVLTFLMAAACWIGSPATPFSPTLLAATPPTTTKAPLPTATETLLPTPTLTGEVTIVDTHAFMYGDEYIVAGLIQNKTNWKLTSIELTVEIKDALGNSVLKDNQGNVVPSAACSPMLTSLLPGEKSPFQYQLVMISATPASYRVTVTGQKPVQIQRAEMEVRNTQVVKVSSFQTVSGNWLRLSGQAVNLSDQWVEVKNISAAELDAHDKLLAVAGAFDWAVLLAPAGDPQGRDRTPFEMAFPDLWQVNDRAFYLDGEDVGQDVQVPPPVEMTNHYFDANGDLHLVGWETNNGNNDIMPAIVAGVYAQDGTVLDLSFTGPTTIRITPTTRYPFDVTHFNVLKAYPQKAGQADHFSVQSEPWILGQSSWKYLDLQTSNDHVEKSRAAWTVSGDILNNSDKDLIQEIVTISIYDAQNNLVAVNFGTIKGSKPTAPQETSQYTVTVLLDPKVDSAEFIYLTAVQGAYK